MNLAQYMPHVLQMQIDGATCANYFVTDSLCCPSRSSIFTGRLIPDVVWDRRDSEVIPKEQLSFHVRRDFDDPKSRYRRQSAIVGDECGAACTDGSNELNCVGGLHACRSSELRGRAQVIMRQVD